MSNIQLNVKDRKSFGKGAARSLRREGRVPAIVYGSNQEVRTFSLSERDLTKLYHKSGYMSSLLDIDLAGVTYHVIPKSVELHPVTDKIEHADFMYVLKDSKVKVLVHIYFLNEEKCIGIKRGGAFNIVKRDIELLCSPNDIPNRIDIDVAQLDIGQTIHIKDIKLPKNSSVIGEDQNFTIATLVGRGDKSASEEETETK